MARDRKGRAKKGRQQPPRSKPKPQFTVNAVRDALRKAAPGADELNQDLRETFELSDSSATLRLR
jgi:hypothetical protein